MAKPTREQLLKQLAISTPSSGDYHDSSDLADVLDMVLSQHGTPTEVIEDPSELQWKQPIA